jgi:hypothetical protein
MNNKSLSQGMAEEEKGRLPSDKQGCHHQATAKVGNIAAGKLNQGTVT